MNKWENVTSDVTIALTDEMRDELGLFDDAEQLKLRIKSVDDDGMPEFEGNIIFEDGDAEPMSVEQITIYTEKYGEKNNGLN